jgi:hypothetical protein
VDKRKLSNSKAIVNSKPKLSTLKIEICSLYISQITTHWLQQASNQSVNDASVLETFHFVIKGDISQRGIRWTRKPARNLTSEAGTAEAAHHKYCFEFPPSIP